KPPPEAPQNLHLDLETTLRSGDLVLGLYDLEVGYEEHHSLVTVDEVEIHRGERVALVGPNGSGKTSLLRTILRRVPPLRGRVRRGSAVRIGYFAQVQAHFDPERTVVETLLDAGMVSISETRSFLARYGFRGEEVFKKVGVLSGGERARVALAILALQRANFLLLDEPTNHLDLPSQEVLQEVLANFDGSILMVSHDRYLIRALATRVWALADGELHDFKGYPSYATWHEARREGGASEEKQAQEEQNHSRQDAERRQERARQRALARQQEQLEDLETTIHELENRLQQLTVSLDLAGRAQDVDRVTRLGAEYRQVEMELNNLLEEWATIADAPVA
ncbi:MAG: ATP-binding cassette domain-containing protein, partial [Anaerolineae bacterium]